MNLMVTEISANTKAKDHGEMFCLGELLPMEENGQDPTVTYRAPKIHCKVQKDNSGKLEMAKDLQSIGQDQAPK